MEEKMLKIEFAYTDELGETTKLEKTFTIDTLQCIGRFEFLVEEFKYFMLSQGFSQDLVNSIQLVESEE